ncbi:B-cell receptor CD22-like isoform X2 [Alosa sapidissima]|uniref:B-cell receptor CD22-like isoform X2 n=1 Tax=Alosa sapidissima TaxID=34773 RepID=UPI001C0987B1|nr:B-cell receptor CD22-like isoform X2 [Alosa sapidissima]
MGQSHKSIVLIIVLSLIQGVSPQQWEVKLGHVQTCAVSGSSVVMPCSFTHPPGLTVTQVYWVIDPARGAESPDLCDNPEYSGRVQYSNDIKTNCTLVLNQVKLSDAHTYHTRIITDQSREKWLSGGVELTITDLTVSEIREPVVERQNAELSCDSACTLTNNPLLVWKKDGKVLPGKQTNNNKKLLLKNVRPGDQGDYSCELKDHTGLPSKPVKLNVMFSPKNTTLSIKPSNVILKGSSVTLTCSSDANPPVQSYSWYKKSMSSPVGSGQQYSITNIRSEDGGQYYCEARNKYGAEKSSAVSITVTGARRSVVYMIAGVSVCGAAGLIFVLRWIRYHTTNTQTSRKEDQGDVKHSSTDPQRSGRSTAAGTPSTEAAGAQEDDVHYASVQLKTARTPQGSRVQPEGEPSVIYSSVYTRA